MFRVRMMSSTLVILLLCAVSLFAQVGNDQRSESFGALAGVLFWVGITCLLLFGAGLLLYEGVKHQNRW